MFKKIVSLQQERHGNWRLKPTRTFAHAGNVNMASIMANEFHRAAVDYPIVFLEDQDSNEFRPVALLGLQPGENLFVDADGRWDGAYVPAIIRRYPFALAKTGDAGRFAVCIDEESDLLGTDEGQPLFDSDGKPSQLLENAKTYLGQLEQMERVTQSFCRKLKEDNMLAPLNLRVRLMDQMQNITGAYTVNEQRLDGLSDEAFLQWRKPNVLPLVYSHLISLSRIERLVQLRERRTSAGGQPAPAAPMTDD